MKRGELALHVELMDVQQLVEIARFHANCEMFDQIGRDLEKAAAEQHGCCPLTQGATESDAIIGAPVATHPTAKSVQ